jgi:hypothetical protein
MKPSSPRVVLRRIAEKILWNRMFSSRLKPFGKPGEWIQHFTSDEEKEILRNLKPEDIANGIQFDWVYETMGRLPIGRISRDLLR